MACASIGFSQDYLERYRELPTTDVAMDARIMESDFLFMRFEDEQDPAGRQRLMEYGLNEVVAVKLPGKDGPLGVISRGLHAVREISARRSRILRQPGQPRWA